jgi:hypothetical protein
VELRDLTPAVITIVLIGIVLGIGVYVLSEFRTQVATDYAGSDLLVPANTTTGYDTATLSDSSKTNYKLSSISVVNATDAHAWTNFTFTEAGVVTFGTDILAAEGSVNITSVYTYDASGSPESALSNTTSGLGDFAGWIAVIVVVIAAAIVLGIVLRSFGAGREA